MNDGAITACRNVLRAIVNVGMEGRQQTNIKKCHEFDDTTSDYGDFFEKIRRDNNGTV